MEQPGCDPAAYISALEKRNPTPKGFRFYSDSFLFTPVERPESSPLQMNVSGIVSEVDDTQTVGVLTRNRFPGAPVQLAKERLPQGQVRGCVVNNRISNVASPTGFDDAVTLADAYADKFGLPRESVLSISTGVIGWSLPVEPMVERIVRLPDNPVGPVAFAEGIMTTDRYPKVASQAFASNGGASILGIVKGAGMIEPNLATMLGFFVTDARIDRSGLDRVFRRVVDRTFNAISVDSDQSTSDMVLLFANGASGVHIAEDELEEALSNVAERLIDGIVRNGEGTAHVIELRVRHVGTDSIARGIAKHVINSPLVKTAIYGNDPNVGRILAACGDALDHIDPTRVVDETNLRIEIFGEEVYRDGAFHLDGERERRLSNALVESAMDPSWRGSPQHDRVVDILLDFGMDHAGEARVLGSDLSYEYVRENADYRS